MVFFVKDAWVWMDHKTEAWLPVQLVESCDGIMVVRSALGEEYRVPADSTMPSVAPSSLFPCANMLSLEELNEGAILHNLRMRYEKDLIYTYISSILLSVNPFKMLPIYSPDIMDEYMERLAGVAEGRAPPPHIYALADATYRSLRNDGRDQAVIVSGESGAGKTEATKLVLQYLTEMSGQGSAVEEQLLEANPIIEAFGNAKTVRNNNSSRFGKWIEIVFDDSFHIGGARITNYLLEKSRIVHQGRGERNYHVFYQLCSGMSDEERAKYYLTSDPSDYAFACSADTSPPYSPAIAHEMAQEYKHMCEALDVLDFSAEERHNMFTVVAAVLHLGNVKFEATESDEKAVVSNPDVLRRVAELLACEQKLLDASLITRTIMVMNESIFTPLGQHQAEEGRDALAKEIYGKLFDWIVRRVNVTLFGEAASSDHSSRPRVVGVLDIFGFEVFETNRFEQLCINYANEKLQQHFNHHIFIMEEREYKADEIDVEHVAFVDNQATLDLIERRPGGIIAMMDEQIRIPRGCDESLLACMHDSLAKSEFYHKPKVNNGSFGIVHYAGRVDYVVEGFLTKNKDMLELGLANVIRSSANSFFSSLLDAPAKSDASVDSADASKRRRGGPSSATLASQFKSQLQKLMQTLNQTSPHFVRCIKPNAQKCADNFDAQMVARQLRYLGIQEVVRIRQKGYPVRFGIPNFWQRFRVLSSEHSYSAANDHNNTERMFAIALLEANVNLSRETWRVGNTKVFLRNSAHRQLEKLREDRIMLLIARVQALVRMRVCRKRYLQRQEITHNLVAALGQDSLQKLEQAIEAYEGLGFLPDIDLFTRARERAKVLYEFQQACVSLGVAVECKDTNLLDTAIEGARRVHLDTNVAIFVRAQMLLRDLTAYHGRMSEAIESRSSIDELRACIKRAEELQVAQHDQKVERARHLIERLQVEKSAHEALQHAIDSRDIDILRTAIEHINEIRMAHSDLLRAAMKLEAELVAIRDVRRELANLLEQNETDQDRIAQVLARGVKAHLSASSDDLMARVEKLRAELVAAELERQRQQEEMEREKQRKHEELAKATQKLESALRDGADVEFLMSSVEFARTLLSAVDENSSTYDVDPSEQLTPLIKQACAAIDVLEQRAAAVKQLQHAIELHTVGALRCAIEAARSAGVDEEGLQLVQALRLLSSTTALLEELDGSVCEKDIEALTKLVHRAREAIDEHADPESWRCVDKAARHLDVLVAERDARAALEVAVRSRTGTMLKQAIDRAITSGVDCDDTLVQQAQVIREEMEMDSMAREQEVIQARRRQTVVDSQRRRASTLRDHRGRSVRPGATAPTALPSEATPFRPSGVPTVTEMQIAVLEVEDEEKASVCIGDSSPGEEMDAAVVESAPLRPPEVHVEVEQKVPPSEPEVDSGDDEPAFIRVDQPRASVSLSFTPVDRSAFAARVRSGYAEANAPEYEFHRFCGLQSPMAFTKGMIFGKKSAKAGMLFFSKGVIPNALTRLLPDMAISSDQRLHKKLAKQSLQMFKSIQGFMGDRHYSFPDSLAHQVLDQALAHPLLRDEFYCQVIKQLRHNARMQSVIRGWQLLALANETFSPSDDMMNHFLHFVQAHCDRGPIDESSGGNEAKQKPGDDAPDTIRQYAQYCLDALSDTIARPLRTCGPTIDYITSFKERVMENSRVFLFFMDGSALRLSVGPTTTAAKLLRTAFSKIGLRVTDGFALFEMREGGALHYVPPESAVADLESVRTGGGELVLSDGVAADLPRRVRPMATRLIVRRRVVATGEGVPGDNVALTLMYYQSVDEVSKGNIVVSSSDIVRLVALHRVITDKSLVQRISRDFLDEHIQVVYKLTSRLPAAYVATGAIDRQNFERRVADFRRSLANQRSGTEHMRAYLGCVAAHPAYGALFFTVQQRHSANFPQNMVLGVSLSGAFLLDWQTRALIVRFPMSGIAGWKGTDATFVYRVQLAQAQWFDERRKKLFKDKGLHTLYMSTQHGKAIAQLVQDCVDTLVSRLQSHKN